MVKQERRALKVRKAKRDVDHYRILMYNEGTRIAQKLVESKVANGGRVPYGYFTELLDEGKECFPKLSRRTINNHVMRIEKRLPAEEDISMDFNLGSIMPNNSETSDVSPLTISSTIANLTSDSDPSPENDEEDSETPNLGWVSDDDSDDERQFYTGTE